MKNKETILKLARSRLPEKQKAIYAGRKIARDGADETSGGMHMQFHA